MTSQRQTTAVQPWHHPGDDDTGRSNAEIGAQLHLSEATVKTHLSRVLAMLGVRDRVQVVIAAFSAGVALSPAIRAQRSMTPTSDAAHVVGQG